MENLGVVDPFWYQKRVLITGHTGFKGSWLSLWLQSMGANVTGFALHPTTTPNLFEIANIATGMKSIYGDIRDLDTLIKVINQTNPQMIIHLAAQSIVTESISNPLETFDINIRGTLNLLEAIRITKCVRVLLNVTSDKCYENKQSNIFKETDPLGGDEPYSSSKACSELVTTAYRHTYFSSNPEYTPIIATARAGNIIGGGDWSEHRILPDIYRAITADRVCLIKNPQATRPWQYVLEPLHGYLILLEKAYSLQKKYAQAWNFGPNTSETYPVAYIADTTYALWGKQANWRSLPEEKNCLEKPMLQINSSKAYSQLNWQTKWPIDKTLEATVSWYKAYGRGDDMYAYSLREIKNYIEN